MPAPRSLRDVHAALADEHRRLMALVSLLESGHDIARLAPMLRELHDLLVDHFAHEQFPACTNSSAPTARSTMPSSRS
jgi:hypothetical protein